MQRAPLELQGRMAAKRVCKSGKMERGDRRGSQKRVQRKCTPSHGCVCTYISVCGCTHLQRPHRAQCSAGLKLTPWSLNMRPTAGSSSLVALVPTPPWLVPGWLTFGGVQRATDGPRCRDGSGEGGREMLSRGNGQKSLF